MPARGGAAGKTGDQYESLWTVHAALRAIDGHIDHVTYESLDPNESRGVEFHLQTESGENEFWSVKRQTTKGLGWSLATLISPDKNGRSILGDLAVHVERNALNHGVFASILGARDLEELRSVSASSTTLKQRLTLSKDLDNKYKQYLLPLFGNNKERARLFLTRLQIHTVDEASLRVHLESMIELLLYPENGGSIDAAAVRRLLAEYLFNHMHQKINRRMLLDQLAKVGYRRKDWVVDPSIREKVAALCNDYIRPLRDSLIGGSLQTLPGANKLLGEDGLPIARRTLITGGAGAGKSSESALVCEKLRVADVPTLPVRMDSIDEGIHTPQQLGKALSLPASPVAVLAGLSNGGASVLIVDQLDAISLASGRRTTMWTLFEHLLAEAEGYPNMRVMAACREFDLEHDHRIRSLKADKNGFQVIKLGSFDQTTVVEILAGRHVHTSLLPLLSVPLHLAMFLSLQGDEREGLETRAQLYDAFWSEKHQRCTQRLGRECNFSGVVGWLAQWLSKHQELSAPARMLPDELRADTDALASEHVIVFSDGRYRFFHESFFDYTFARRFVQKGEHLLDLLINGEQHLFRRAQVRQILAFLRSSDPHRYITELRSVLTDSRVRFHIKRVVFQYLSAITVPTREEWSVLRDLEAQQPEQLNHVNQAISNHAGWFDTLEAAGFLASGFSNTDKQQEERVVWLCAMLEVLKHRSARVADLLLKYRRDDDTWRKYLQYICKNGNVFYSREFFDLFLTLIQDGTLDGTRPGYATNDNWWMTLYSMGDEAPAMASEAIASWYDRKIAVWERSHPNPNLGIEQSRDEDREDSDEAVERNKAVANLRQRLDEDGNDCGVIAKAAEAAFAFVEQLLPRIASFLASYAAPCRDRLDIDPLWSIRSFGDDEHQVHGKLYKSLAHALETLSATAPDDLDRLLDPFVGRSEDALAYLVLRAWTAASATYADRLAHFLAEDPRRLKVGYAISGGVNAGAGMANAYRSIEAVRTASKHCTDEALNALEQAIVDLNDEWESQHPRSRGLRQFQLLAAFDQSRLGPGGRSKLEELRAKFPEVTHESPEAMEAVWVGPPISADAQEKMTDDQWLSAMVKYADAEHRQNHNFDSGGEHELASALESKTTGDPKRFVSLAARMPDSLPVNYFDAILRGVAAAGRRDQPDGSDLELSSIVALIARVHALPNRPCGRWLTNLVRELDQLEWPTSIVEIVCWYAMNDADPSEEVWLNQAPSGGVFNGGDPDMSGQYSTRGSAANAVASLLFADRTPTNVLVDAVDRLAHDDSIAVRSQAVYALLALLRTQPDIAISWFVDCVSVDTVLLKTRFVSRFLQYASQHDYTAIRPTLRKMVASDDEKILKTGCKLCCLAAFNVEAPQYDAEFVRLGLALPRLKIIAFLPQQIQRQTYRLVSLPLRFRSASRQQSQLRRESAAEVYAANISNSEVGRLCREFILPYFMDPSENVRKVAAKAFRDIDELESSDQGRLLAAFLDGQPGADALEPVIRAIEKSPIQLPDLTCQLIDASIEQFEDEAGDIRTHSALVASQLSKIVIRLYTQSDDEAIRIRCLHAIDRMEQAAFFGLSDELGRLDR